MSQSNISVASFPNGRSVTLIFTSQVPSGREEPFMYHVHISKVNSGIALPNPRKNCGFAAYILTASLVPSQCPSEGLIAAFLLGIPYNLTQIWDNPVHRSPQSSLLALAIHESLVRELEDKNHQMSQKGKQQFQLNFSTKMSEDLHIPAGHTEIWCPNSQAKHTRTYTHTDTHTNIYTHTEWWKTPG